MESQNEKLPQYVILRTKFQNLLKLPDCTHSQDWDIEQADGSRLEDIIGCYKNHAKTDNEKSLLMELIVASFDNYFWEENQDFAMWERIKILLKQDQKLFEDIIEYWCVWDGGDDPECYFNISPLMRELSKNKP